MVKPKSRSFNNATLVLAVTIAIICLLIIIKVMLPKKDTEVTVITPKDLEKPSKNIRNRVTLTELGPSLPGKTETVLKTKTEKIVLQPSLETMRYKLYLEQKKIVEDFRNTVRLKAPFPNHLQYVSVDTDSDQYAAIYGVSLDGKTELGVVATYGDKSVKEMVEYLQKESASYPMLNQFSLDANQAFELPVKPSPASGLKAFTAVPSKGPDGSSMYAVVAPRADGKGTYVFMMAAPSSEFNENEEGINFLLKNIRTLDQ